MIPPNIITQENEREMQRVRALADALGVRFDEVVRIGSQGTVIGIQSRSVLFSQRLDSRTVFVQDSRYGAGLEAGVYEGNDDELVRVSRTILEKLDIPVQEVADTGIRREQVQQAQVDARTGEARIEEARAGKAMLRVTRRIEGLPVWSSGVTLGLTKKGDIGFLEAHWPDISAAVLEEAKRLADRIKEGWRPPDRPGGKPESVEAGILHSPAAGFIMDIYPAIRVIYGDESMGKKATLYFDRHGNPVPIPRQFDKPPDAAPAPRGEPPGGAVLDPHRQKFRALLLANPNYFGNLQGSPFPPKFDMSLNTTYEELGCIGYQPQFRRLEGVVYLKQNSGYGGGLCSPGTQEYVRFYLSFDNGATWHDQGMTSFTAWDIPFEGRLEYAVALDIQPNERLCLFENLPLVRAILSWDDPPPPNTPDFPPVWGNVKQERIQIGAWDFPDLDSIFTAAKVKLPPSILSLVDVKKPVPLKKPDPLTPAQLFERYRLKDVPPHRFLHKQFAQYLSAPVAIKSGAGPFSMPDTAIDWATILETYLATDGNTSFEELTCIGLEPNDDLLVGVIKVKLPNGFSGGLCEPGSQEYVAFWVDHGAGWTYAGTTSVNVHDLVGVPAGGLHYAVFLPVNLAAHRRPCGKGPVYARVRAILSWNMPPPPGDPNYRPTWGNREETLIHIKPGPTLDGQVPYLSSVGDVAESNVNANGKANGSTIHTGLVCSDSPFGGRIVISGHVSNASPGLKYRVMRKPHLAPDTSYVPMTNEPSGLSVYLNQFDGVTWTQTLIVMHADSNGWYPYEDYSSNHSIEKHVLHVWHSTVAEDGLTFDLRIELDTDNDGVADSHSNVVSVLVDNTPPDAALDIDLGVGVECADFAPGATFSGHYTASDTYFGSFSFEIQPSGPAHGVLPVPPSGTSAFLGGSIGDPGVVGGVYTLNTGAAGGVGPMDPCGYALILHVSDRTNVNSGGGRNYAQKAVGFCLQAQHP
jgi:hypothetical protein